MNNIKYEVKTLPAYRAMGLKCDVSFTEIETIKEVIESSINRAEEFEYPVNLEERLALSYHLRPDGFTYYSVYEVYDQQELPDNMVEIHIPEMTYLVVKHKGDTIEETYEEIMKWLSKSDYEPFREKNVEYYDELPIKHERYVSGKTDFEILIPINKF